MPCRDYYDNHPELYYAETIDGLRKQVYFAESALCQVLEAFYVYAENEGQDCFQFIDYATAGITRADIEKWWNKHRENDAKVETMIKAAALAKLTAEERKVLGV